MRFALPNIAGRFVQVAVFTLSASTVVDYQREADLCVSQYRNRLSVFGLHAQPASDSDCLNGFMQNGSAPRRAIQFKVYSIARH
jgi:hypothetical protein